MARFYKTASANPLDYMYKLNTPLMERVLTANDNYITQNLQQADKIETAVTSFPYLQADDKRAKAIADEYTKKVEALTDAIRTDPANWRNQLGPIRDITRELQSNYKTGEISKITGNYSQYKKVSDYIDKELENYNKTGKGISADRAKAYKEHFLRKFTDANPEGTAYNPKTGEYNPMNTFDPMANMDIKKVLGEELDKIKADKNKYQKDEVTGQEWYFNEKSHSWEGVTPEKILNIVTDRLNNPQLMDYLKQDSQIGLIRGVYDENGRFVNPYSYNAIPASEEEAQNIKDVEAQIAKTKNPNLKEQLKASLETYKQGINGRKSLAWNGNSYLAPIMRGLVNQHSYSKVEDVDKLRNNSKGSTQYIQGQTNARLGRTLAQQKELATMREKGINDRFKQTMDEKIREWDNPHTTSKGTTKPIKPIKPATSDTPKVANTLPEESGVSKLATNSFEDWTTQDANGQTVKVLSNEGLSSDIGRLRTERAEATKQVGALENQMNTLLGNRKISDLGFGELNTYNNLRVKKEALQQNIPKIDSDLNARRKWYQVSVEAALSNNSSALKDADGNTVTGLTPEEIAIYKKYDGDKDGSKERERIAKMPHGVTVGVKGKPGQDLGVLKLQAQENLDKYLSIKKKVDDRRSNFLAQVRYTPIETDAIKVGKEDSKAIADMIFANPQGLHLFDNTGNKTDKLGLEGKGINWFNPKGDNYKMTTVDDEKNIVNYMKKYNVVPSIRQVGNTTKIGTGNAVAEIVFDDPTGEIPKSSFYVELTPDLQKRIGTRLGLSKNPEVQKIANNILDDEANDIRRQLITPTIQRTAGAGDNYDPVTFTVFIGAGNKKIPFQVTKFAASNGQDHLSITGSVNGVQIPLDGTQSGIPGWFNGADDFINYIKTQRNK